VHPSQVLFRAPDAGLDIDSSALGRQVWTMAKSRLGTWSGIRSPQAMAQLHPLLPIGLDLPGQP
jgi:mRNA interferase MazF